MRILIYSGTSLVGRNIVGDLANQKHDVICTYRNPANIPNEFKNNPKIALFHLCHSQESLVKSRFTGIDAIINSTGAYPTNSVTHQDVIYANIKTAEHIVESYKLNKDTLRCVINYSSLSVYGDLNESLFNEKVKPSPLDLYGTTKLISEQILNQIYEYIPVYHLRFPVVLGKNSHRAWLPTVLEKMLEGKDVSVNNNNSLYNCCTGMSEIIALTKRILDSTSMDLKNNIFPLGSIPDISISSIINMMAYKTKYQGQILQRDDNRECCYVDYSNALQIGYEPRVTSEVVKEWLRLNLE